MKIKNDYIIINKGKKQIKLHNLILNKYIEQIIANQMETDAELRHSLLMSEIYIKFDNELSFDATSILSESDFDLKAHYYTMNDDITPTQAVFNYFYKTDSTPYNVFDISLQQFISDLSAYFGKKITAIGFGEIFQNTDIIYACVDTSKYNIYLEAEDEIFSVARRDILSTDMLFYCSNKAIKGSLHLCNGQFHYDNSRFMDFTYIAVLESIGLSTTIFNMDIETKLTPYNTHLDLTELNKIKINDEFTIEYKSDGLFPASDLYPALDLYPARIIEEPLYPSLDIYPGEEQYMVAVPYQYMQLKYQIYKMDTIEGTITRTNDFYLLSKRIENNQKIKMNINYERA